MTRLDSTSLGQPLQYCCYLWKRECSSIECGKWLEPSRVTAQRWPMSTIHGETEVQSEKQVQVIRVVFRWPLSRRGAMMMMKAMTVYVQSRKNQLWGQVRLSVCQFIRVPPLPTVPEIRTTQRTASRMAGGHHRTFSLQDFNKKMTDWLMMTSLSMKIIMLERGPTGIIDFFPLLLATQQIIALRVLCWEPRIL